MKTPLPSLIEEDRFARLPLAVGVGICAAVFLYVASRTFTGPAGARWLDAQWIYVAGTCWRRGVSPYNAEAFGETWRAVLGTPSIDAFSYPPSVAVFAVPLSLLPVGIARGLYDVANLAALALCLFFTLRMLVTATGSSWRHAGIWIAIGVACLLSSAAAALHIGQTVVFATAGLLGGMYFWQRRQLLPAAVCFAVAATKPHVTLFPLVYCFVGFARREVFLGGVLSILLWVVGLSFAPINTLFQDLAHSHQIRMTNPFNSSRGLTGMSSVLEGSTWAFHWTFWGALGAVLVVGVAFKERCESSPDACNPHDEVDRSHARGCRKVPLLAFQIPWVAAGVFLPLHTYDQVLMIPVAAHAMVHRGPRLLLLLPAMAVAGRSRTISRLLGDSQDAHTLLQPGSMTTVALLAMLLLFLGERRFRQWKTAVDRCTSETAA